MKYRILKTDKAEDQIRSIIHYIADETGDAMVALSYLEKMEKAIERLEDLPESGQIPRYSILKKQGYRVVIMDQHLAFYKVNHAERVATIYAVVDGRQEYLRLIE